MFFRKLLIFSPLKKPHWAQTCSRDMPSRAWQVIFSFCVIFKFKSWCSRLFFFNHFCSLTGLLSSFVEVESIKRHFKSRLVGTVLNGYLCLRKLVVQRTKLIDETQDMLLEMLEDMTTGSSLHLQVFSDASVLLETKSAQCSIFCCRDGVWDQSIYGCVHWNCKAVQSGRLSHPCLHLREVM